MEALNACPHHGFDTWLLVNYFDYGISPTMKQLLETTCGGDSMSKNPEEALDFLSYVAKASKAWDEPNPRKMERMRPQSSARGGMYSLLEDMDMRAKVLTLSRRLEELEMRKLHEVQAVTEIPVPNKPCFICQLIEHLGEQCPTIPAMREMLVEQAIVGQFKPSTNAPYGNTYNLVGGITQISLGSQNLHNMHLLLLHSMHQHLSHHNHSQLLQLSKPF